MKLFFAGDVVLADGCANQEILSERLKIVVGGVDVACCNFEAPVAEGMKKKKKVGPNNKNAITTVPILAHAGFNLVTLANNHIFDFGCDGMQNTIQTLNLNGIHTVGAGCSNDIIDAPYIADDGNCTVAIINVAENGFGCAAEDSDSYGYAYVYAKNLKERIAALKEACKAVIVVCHAGAEMWDIPLPEWRETYRELIDVGADAVVAHHPHVPQGYEKYNNRYIFYSLGNFAFDKGRGPTRPESYTVLITVEDNIKCEIIPTIFKNGIVDVNDSVEFREHLDWCSSLISDEKTYMEEINKKCLESYEYYKNCYGKAAVCYRGSVKERLKGIVKRYFMRQSFQDIWLYHNISIETHLYVCRRAVRLLLKEKEIL